MKAIKNLLILVMAITAIPVLAQDTSPGKNMVRSYIGELGKTETAFFAENTDRPSADTGFRFRRAFTATLKSDFLSTAEFYFTGKQPYQLYEVILEFKNQATRETIIRELYGAPNYPGQEDHWILKGPGGLTCVAWAFKNKFVVATALPGSEWDGESMFKIPAEFKSGLNYK